MASQRASNEIANPRAAVVTAEPPPSGTKQHETWGSGDPEVFDRSSAKGGSRCGQTEGSTEGGIRKLVKAAASGDERVTNGLPIGNHLSGLRPRNPSKTTQTDAVIASTR